jgi:hypothetical protein
MILGYVGRQNQGGLSSSKKSEMVWLRDLENAHRFIWRKNLDEKLDGETGPLHYWESASTLFLPVLNVLPLLFSGTNFRGDLT